MKPVDSTTTPEPNTMRRCRHCGKPIMFTKYNGRFRWCHVPLLRVRCQEVTEAEPEDRAKSGWPASDVHRTPTGWEDGSGD